ncbi:hypothetical protein [Stenotrophomonas muris]|uniref:hypothetical protein n=1 Tax=Stenotrophomonas muris TaxID=2963283 RepID=UPI0040558823
MLEALFVATVRVSCAATGANDAYDWKWLVPVITLILGFVLKWFQDYLTEKGRRRHDKELRREQRYDVLRMRRLEAERANLLTLQPMVTHLVRQCSLCHMERVLAASSPDSSGWEKSRISKDLNEDFRKALADLVPLRARLHSSDVSTLLDALISDVVETQSVRTGQEQAEEIWFGLSDKYEELQKLIGNHIRALEDENQQLGDPPAR